MRTPTLSAAALGLLISELPAHADQAFEITQLACAPGSHYFSAERHTVWDINPRERPRSGDFALVSTQSLEKTPFTCAWANHNIEVRAFKPKRSDPCWPSYADSVEILLDGKHLDCLEGASSKFNEHRATITVNRYDLPSPANGDILTEHCSVDLESVDADKHDRAEAGNTRCVTKIFKGTSP